MTIPSRIFLGTLRLRSLGWKNAPVVASKIPSLVAPPLPRYALASTVTVVSGGRPSRREIGMPASDVTPLIARVRGPRTCPKAVGIAAGSDNAAASKAARRGP